MTTQLIPLKAYILLHKDVPYVKKQVTHRNTRIQTEKHLENS